MTDRTEICPLCGSRVISKQRRAGYILCMECHFKAEDRSWIMVGQKIRKLAADADKLCVEAYNTGYEDGMDA